MKILRYNNPQILLLQALLFFCNFYRFCLFRDFLFHCFIINIRPIYSASNDYDNDCKDPLFIVSLRSVNRKYSCFFIFSSNANPNMRSCSFNVRFKLSTILYKSDEYLIRVVDRTSIFLSMKNSSVTQKFLIIEERNAVTIRVHSLQPLLHHPSIIAGHVQQKRFQVENRYILYTRSKKNKIPPTHIFTPEVYMHFRRIFPSILFNWPFL